MARLINKPPVALNIETWLKRHPREVTVLIGARTGLRFLPLIGLEDGRHRNQLTKVRHLTTRAVYDALLISWLAARHPTESPSRLRFHAARATAEASHVIDYPSSHGYRHASAALKIAAFSVEATSVSLRSTTVLDGSAASSASHAAHLVAAAVQLAADELLSIAPSSSATNHSFIEADMNLMEREMRPERIAILPLWPEQTPDWVENGWERLKRMLLSSDYDDWTNLINWYERRLTGGTVGKSAEFERLFSRASVPKRSTPPIPDKKKQEQETVSELPDTSLEPAPDVPLSRPAAINPVWENRQLTLPKGLAKNDLPKATFRSALRSLKQNFPNFL